MTFYDGIAISLFISIVVSIFTYINHRNIVSIKKHRENFLGNVLRNAKPNSKKALINLELAELFIFLNKENKIISNLIVICTILQLTIYINFPFTIFTIVFLTFCILIFSTSRIKSQILLTILLYGREKNETNKR